MSCCCCWWSKCLILLLPAASVYPQSFSHFTHGNGSMCQWAEDTLTQRSIKHERPRRQFQLVLLVIANVQGKAQKQSLVSFPLNYRPIWWYESVFCNSKRKGPTVQQVPAEPEAVVDHITTIWSNKRTTAWSTNWIRRWLSLPWVNWCRAWPCWRYCCRYCWWLWWWWLW